MGEKSTVEGGGGVPLHVRTDGAGEPVLLVHGTIGSSGDWAQVTPHLSGDRRVISYDRRGRGRSGDGPSYALSDDIGDLLRVLAWIGEPAHVVAHSFGARIALLAAAQSTFLRTVVLYEPPLSPEDLSPALQPAFDEAERTGDHDAIATEFLRQVEVDAEQEALLRSLPPAWNALLDGARTVRREVEALAAAGFHPDELDVRVPAHVLVGGDTTAPLFLDHLDELCQRLGTSPQPLAGQRHLAMVFAPELLASAVRDCLA